MSDSVVITRKYERHGCWFVEGRFLDGGTWRDGAFTAVKGDVEHMSYDDFEAFAKRQLPYAPVDHDWKAQAV